MTQSFPSAAPGAGIRIEGPAGVRVSVLLRGHHFLGDLDARVTAPVALVANTGSLGSRAASPAFVLAQAFAALAFAWLGVIRVRLVGLAQPLRNAISAALVSSG